MREERNLTVEQMPLSNLTVLELGSFITAPYCCKLLADMGADVVKIEKPAKGDVALAGGIQVLVEIPLTPNMLSLLTSASEE